MTHDYEVTHNEDGTFSISLPDGDELRIVSPKKEWVGLTEEEQQELHDQWQKRMDGWGSFYQAIEAKLKEKNT